MILDHHLYSVGIPQQELYRKLRDAALASNNSFVHLCRMYDMGFRGQELVGLLVRYVEEDEPGFKFSHMKLLVDMGVIVPTPPLPALGAPVDGSAPGSAPQPRPKWSLFGLCGLRAKEEPRSVPGGRVEGRSAEDEARLPGWAWPATKQSGYN